MKNKLNDKMSLGQMDRLIKEELPGKEYWGELDLSYEEYQYLKNRITTLMTNSNASIDRIYSQYPHAVTSLIVFLIVYKYNTNFWDLLSKELNTKLHATEIGDKVLSVFNDYKFDYSDVKDEPRKYVAPIIYEAGLPPESSLKDLFYILKYDLHESFDPYIFLDELIEMRSYKLRKPMIRFLQRFKDEKALDFVLMIRDAMLAVEQKMDYESRYIVQYTEWKKTQRLKDGNSSRKKNENQAIPYVFFDTKHRGFSIVLPRYELDEEWIEDIQWTITKSDGTNKTVHCNILEDHGRRYSDSLTVAVGADTKYIITMEDGEGIEEVPLEEWTIAGVPDNGYLYFNANGRMIRSPYLQYPYGILVAHKSIVITEDKNLSIGNLYYPTDSADYCCYTLLPSGPNAVIDFEVFNVPTKLIAKPQIRIDLEGKTLFDLGKIDESCNLFTELPKVIIDLKEVDDLSGLELRIGSQTLSLYKYTDGSAVIDLKNRFRNQKTPFGTYAIRLYQNGRFLKQVEFNYVPKIKSSFSTSIEWPSAENRNKPTLLTFEKIADWDLEFSDCIVYEGDNDIKIKCAPSTSVIPGLIRSKINGLHMVCKFELPIRPIEALLIDENGNEENITAKSARLDLVQLDEAEKWLSLRTPVPCEGRTYYLKLLSGNGIEQSELLRFSQGGNILKQLGAFHDTLKSCPLPAQIVLDYLDNPGSSIPLLTIFENSVFKKQIKKFQQLLVLSTKDADKDISITRFGSDLVKHELSLSKSILDKPGKNRGYKLPKYLPEGIYVVSASDDSEFFFVDDVEEIRLSEGYETIYIENDTKEASPVIFKENLKNLIKAILEIPKKGALRNNSKFTAFMSMKPVAKKDLDQFDIENLIALAYFTDSKMLNVNKQAIFDCMSFINKYFLTDTDRVCIIQLLSKLNPTASVFELCMKKYTLMLVQCKNATNLAEEIEHLSLELSLLLRMQSFDSIRNTIGKERYREYIGNDAIHHLISFPANLADDQRKLELRKFIKEQKGCHVCIKLSSEISGEMAPISEMVETGPKGIPYLDRRKKPDTGIYFARIRYVDQYVNWYSLHHNRTGEIKDSTKQLMKSVVQENIYDIWNCIQRLNKDPLISSDIKHYESALSARLTGQLSLISQANEYPRYFYLQGMAAFLSKLPIENGKYDSARKLGIRFMMTALEIAPRMAQRDLIMATTFIYLKRKEALLCR